MGDDYTPLGCLWEELSGIKAQPTWLSVKAWEAWIGDNSHYGVTGADALIVD
jgi:hypothetical protein